MKDILDCCSCLHGFVCRDFRMAAEFSSVCGRFGNESYAEDGLSEGERGENAGRIEGQLWELSVETVWPSFKCLLQPRTGRFYDWAVSVYVGKVLFVGRFKSAELLKGAEIEKQIRVKEVEINKSIAFCFSGKAFMDKVLRYGGEQGKFIFKQVT